MTDPLPVSVAIPTIGRPVLLRGCLESLVRCRPRAAEVLVVDQSEGSEVAATLEDFAAFGARRIECAAHGIALARNISLSSVRHDIVLFTDDDCTVDADWVGAAFRHMQARRRSVITGRVLPAEGPDTPPSTIEGEEPRDYTGNPHPGVLFTGNMALNRVGALELAGFDERFPDAGEDTDFGYRWIKAGRELRYEPDMVVWHQQWRTRRDLERIYVAYAYGNGLFYAKHLRRGDLGIIRWILLDLYAGSRSLAGRYLRGTPRWAVWQQGILPGLPRGLAHGWRLFRDEAPSGRVRPADAFQRKP